MDQKVKFAKLVAKTGVHFGAVDGKYDDKEKAFVNLFIGYLKLQGTMDADVESIIKEATSQKYLLKELVDETNDCLKDLSAEERKQTLESMKNFITTIVCIDGTESYSEQNEFEQWKKELGID
ncbi:MAG: hypothetical protein K6G31_06125 [Paludibacteraceae bacterium]|nr:hypothetical protein [Paludibacteraceae bacterium]MCR5568835.1 hypothetical protein [Paludibacteraceae bacterium]